MFIVRTGDTVALEVNHQSGNQATASRPDCDHEFHVPGSLTGELLYATIVNTGDPVIAIPTEFKTMRDISETSVEYEAVVDGYAELRKKATPTGEVFTENEFNTEFIRVLRSKIDSIDQIEFTFEEFNTKPHTREQFDLWSVMGAIAGVDMINDEMPFFVGDLEEKASKFGIDVESSTFWGSDDEQASTSEEENILRGDKAIISIKKQVKRGTSDTSVPPPSTKNDLISRRKM